MGLSREEADHILKTGTLLQKSEPVLPEDATPLEIALAELVDELHSKWIAPLQRRVAELESRPQLKHCGTWKESEMYTPANLVTDKGSLWICKSATHKRPGDSGDWQLIVKSGHATDDTRFPTKARERSTNTS